MKYDAKFGNRRSVQKFAQKAGSYVLKTTRVILLSYCYEFASVVDRLPTTGTIYIKEGVAHTMVKFPISVA